MEKRTLKNYCIGDANVYADRTISQPAKALYGLLCCYANKYGVCNPGITRLAWEMGVDERTVQRQMAQLIEAGVIFRDNNKGLNKKTIILDAKNPTWKDYDKFTTD